MPRMFNIAGPCIPGEHYLVPTLARLPQLDGLIAAKQFFVIHAARQSGKTTLLNALEQELNAKHAVVARLNSRRFTPLVKSAISAPGTETVRSSG